MPWKPSRWGHTPPSLADSTLPHIGTDTHRRYALHRTASASGILEKTKQKPGEALGQIDMGEQQGEAGGGRGAFLSNLEASVWMAGSLQSPAQGAPVGDLHPSLLCVCVCTRTCEGPTLPHPVVPQTASEPGALGKAAQGTQRCVMAGGACPLPRTHTLSRCKSQINGLTLPSLMVECQALRVESRSYQRWQWRAELESSH